MGKASAVFFYARIFSLTNSGFKYALWLVHFMNVAWLLAILLSVTFMCDPVEKAWDTTLSGKCLNTGLLWLGSGVSSLIIDVIILLMPLPMLWKLQMKTIRRIQISGVFLCGYLWVALLQIAYEYCASLADTKDLIVSSWYLSAVLSPFCRLAMSSNRTQHVRHIQTICPNCRTHQQLTATRQDLCTGPLARLRDCHFSHQRQPPKCVLSSPTRAQPGFLESFHDPHTGGPVQAYRHARLELSFS